MLGPWCVRRAGYGAMQLAGDGVFGPSRDRHEAVRVLRAAAAAGMNHIDTAQFYGAGTVNELIREALNPYPDGLAIVSKVGARRDAGGAWLRSWEARELRQGIADNLRALGTGRLAVVNLRVMDPSETPGRRFDAQLAMLVQAREEGLIDGIGLSNVSRAQLLRAVAQTQIVCVQNLFNLADQRFLDVLTECQARNIAFVPFCPLGLPARCGTGCSPIRCSPRWGHGWAPRRCRSRSPGCWTLPRMCCSFRELGRELIWPRTWPAPTSSWTMTPGRSCPALPAI
jgi:aryl-alcohol dehydrogenase-like predicted oxidoreductase